MAPVALTGRSAERTHLSGVESCPASGPEGHVLRIAREDARQPITGRSFDAPFVHARVLCRIATRHELGLAAPLPRGRPTRRPIDQTSQRHRRRLIAKIDNQQQSGQHFKDA
jgi:hypothetical protein